MGSFESEPKLKVEAIAIAEPLLVEIALTALKDAKVSWTGRRS